MQHATWIQILDVGTEDCRDVILALIVEPSAATLSPKGTAQEVAGSAACTAGTVVRVSAGPSAARRLTASTAGVGFHTHRLLSPP